MGRAAGAHLLNQTQPCTFPRPAPGRLWKAEAVAGTAAETAACLLATAEGSVKARTGRSPCLGGGGPRAGQGGPGQEACVGLSPGFTAALADPVSGPPSGKLLSEVSS